MARRGVFSCAVGLVLLAILPQLVAENTTAAVRLLQGAAVCLAFTSATVVNSLTSYASLQCDEGVNKETGKPVTEHPQLAKGKALGQFRSSGQLGRAIGPLLGTSERVPTPVFICLIRIGSLRFILDIRTFFHLRCWCSCHVALVVPYEKTGKSQNLQIDTTYNKLLRVRIKYDFCIEFRSRI